MKYKIIWISLGTGERGVGQQAYKNLQQAEEIAADMEELVPYKTYVAVDESTILSEYDFGVPEQ